MFETLGTIHSSGEMEVPHTSLSRVLSYTFSVQDLKTFAVVPVYVAVRIHHVSTY
jgi:hypothetical protein